MRVGSLLLHPPHICHSLSSRLNVLRVDEQPLSPLLSDCVSLSLNKIFCVCLFHTVCLGWYECWRWLNNHTELLVTWQRTRNHHVRFKLNWRVCLPWQPTLWVTLWRRRYYFYVAGFIIIDVGWRTVTVLTYSMLIYLLVREVFVSRNTDSDKAFVFHLMGFQFFSFLAAVCLRFCSDLQADKMLTFVQCLLKNST